MILKLYYAIMYQYTMYSINLHVFKLCINSVMLYIMFWGFLPIMFIIFACADPSSSTYSIFLFNKRTWVSASKWPTSSAGKESTYNAGDPGSIAVLGRSPGGGHGNPLQYSCLENPHGQRSLAGYSPCVHTELDTTEVTKPQQQWVWNAS